MSKKNNKETYDIQDVSEEYLVEIDETKLPNIISERVALLEATNKAYEEAKEKEKKSRDKVDGALKKADELIVKAKNAGKKEATPKKFFKFEYTSKKDEISTIKENLEEIMKSGEFSAEATKELAEVQAALAESQASLLKVQETQMAYQGQIADATKFLYGLCAYNYGATQSVLINLQATLKGASREKLGEMAQQQLLLAMDQLKNQESIVNKIKKNRNLIDNIGSDVNKQQKQVEYNTKANEELNQRIKALKEQEDSLFAQLNAKAMLLQENILHDERQDEQIKEQAQKGLERDKKIAEREAYDEKQDKILEEHALKDELHDRQIAERVEYDAKQDKILEEQALKDELHDRQIAERVEYDAKQDKILEEQALKDELHDRQIAERIEYDVKQDKILEEQALKDELHDRQIAERVEYDAKQDKILAKHTSKVIEHDKMLLLQQEKNNEYEQEFVDLQELNNELKEEIIKNARKIDELSEIIEKLNAEKSSKKLTIYSLILGAISMMGVIIHFFI